MTLTYKQFIETMTDTERKFKAAIADFPEHAKFLSKCYLVVTRNSSQFSFKKHLSRAEISELIVLVTDSALKDNLLSLNKQLKDAHAAAKKAQGHEGARVTEQIKKIEKELNSFPLEELNFHDDFNVEARFPSVNMEIIQMLKQHPLMVKKKQCMCTACIRVYFY